MEFSLDKNASFMVVCSDGVWEFLSNEDVCKMVKPYFEKNEPKGAVDKLIKESVKFWEQEDEVIDDITVIVVFFNE